MSCIVSLHTLTGVPSDYKIMSSDFIANLRLNKSRCKSFLEHDWTNLGITHIALGTEHKLSGQAPLSFRKVRILRNVFQDDFACRPIPVYMQDDKMTLIH